MAVICLMIDGGGTFMVREPESVGATLEESEMLLDGTLMPERRARLAEACMGAAQVLILAEIEGRC